MSKRRIKKGVFAVSLLVNLIFLTVALTPNLSLDVPTAGDQTNWTTRFSTAILGIDTWGGGVNNHIGDTTKHFLQSAINIPVSQISDIESYYYTETETNALLASKEPVFSKNTGFNKAFGTSVGTVLEGSHDGGNQHLDWTNASTNFLTTGIIKWGGGTGTLGYSPGQSANIRGEAGYFLSLGANGPGNKVILDVDGNLAINPLGTVGTAKLDINSDIVRLRTPKTPASSAAAGNQGDMCWDSNYFYVCVSTNSWIRFAKTTW